MVYAPIDVSSVIDKGVCVLKLPFFVKRINRDLYSSEMVKVFFSNYVCILENRDVTVYRPCTV